MKKLLLLSAAVLFACIYAPTPAQADVRFAVQIGSPGYGGGYYGGGYCPPPVYYAPPPVVYRAPRQVYYAPRQVYYAPPRVVVRNTTRVVYRDAYRGGGRNLRNPNSRVVYRGR